MPTQRFFKLKEEKRRLILEAGAHEFSRVPYSAASINQIIKEADISRGSFYTYFEDKDDLMRYMLRGMREHFRERVMLLLKEMGSPFAVCLQMVREWMDKGNDHIFYKIHKNLLSDLSVSNQNQIFGFRGFTLKDDPYEGFIKDIYEHMDREHYPMSLEALIYGADVAAMVCIRAMSLYCQKPQEKESILQATETEMRILEKGVCSLQAAK